ncbi:hypothetical protein [Rhizobium rhizogenes]|uniref:hypothetical protein n=1 Tax=Rhizobium rhizogenes TaxID=359 RepID=UPI0004D5424D|nr:hypothetical protein [Rhizobium rhizogenes]KEA07108.1 hypothetical protein CN09_09090 [Rhizobium rhizogenes]NTI80472.1 hypothetical protein [Rhizobium rhizogenes]NTJ22658.1 hypothetical protein [Rhizobium rhizogenes]QUE81362.1 hypothetical protein EML492_06020 [Rhizobium rhizogenes]TQO80543.1 hypothetical protein FFE80_05420 [Rhizobium rhizogenes]
MIAISALGGNQAAINLAHSMGDDICIDCPVTITTADTWPKGKIYHFSGDGALNPCAGIILTIRGTVKAARWRNFPANTPSPNHIFGGEGNVIGLLKAYPGYWGAKEDGISDDQPALQAAHDCVAASKGSDGEGWAEIILSPSIYGIGNKFEITPTGSVPIKMRGSGATGDPAFGGTAFKCLAVFTGNVALHLQGQSTWNTEHIAGWDIGDFNIIRDAQSPAQFGFWCGGDADGLNLVGSQQSLIENVYVNVFDVTWRFQQIRLATIRRCSGWSNTNVCIEFAVPDARLFTGDMDFRECQFVANRQAATTTANIYIHGTGGAINGVRFYGCQFYQSDVAINVNSGGVQIADWWFRDCQFDSVNKMFSICMTSSASQIFDWHISGCYGQGLTGPFVVTSISGGAVLQDVFIEGNWIRGAELGSQNLLSFAGSVAGIHVSNNMFVACRTTSYLIVFASVATELDVSHNTVRAYNGSTASHLIAFGANSNRYVAVGNKSSPGYWTAAPVLELKPTATKYIAGNF